MIAVMNTPEFKNESFFGKLKMLLTASPDDMLKTEGGRIVLPAKPTSGVSSVGYWTESILGATGETILDWARNISNPLQNSFSFREMGNIVSSAPYAGRNAVYANIVVGNPEEAGRVVNELSSGSSVDQVELNYTNAAGNSFWIR